MLWHFSFGGAGGFACPHSRRPQRYTARVKHLLLLSWIACASAQQVQVREFMLDNGMKLLMVPRKGTPNVNAGWVAKVGSVNERPGITGISHLFEHMMFKGTQTIGTRNIE